MGTFAYALGRLVALKYSVEQGVIIGRAEYATMENQYFIRYKAADGRQVEAWWGESALSG